MANEKVLIEGARLGFRNFQGREGRFNAEGERSFGLFLTEEQAEDLAGRGCNVRRLRPLDEEDPGQPVLNVRVNYRMRDGRPLRFPPKVVLVTSGGNTELTEETVGAVDGVDIETVDLYLTLRPWEVRGQRGIKAYLHSLYVVVNENFLERKYASN